VDECGLVQCYDDETSGILWLCKEHRSEYSPIQSPESPESPELNGLRAKWEDSIYMKRRARRKNMV
jgi:hypothetical protein